MYPRADPAPLLRWSRRSGRRPGAWSSPCPSRSTTVLIPLPVPTAAGRRCCCASPTRRSSTGRCASPASRSRAGRLPARHRGTHRRPPRPLLPRLRGRPPSCGRTPGRADLRAGGERPATAVPGPARLDAELPQCGRRPGLRDRRRRRPAARRRHLLPRPHPGRRPRGVRPAGDDPGGLRPRFPGRARRRPGAPDRLAAAAVTVGREHVLAVARVALRMRQRAPLLFGTAVPAFTREVAPGVALADEPGRRDAVRPAPLPVAGVRAGPGRARGRPGRAAGRRPPGADRRRARPRGPAPEPGQRASSGR